VEVRPLGSGDVAFLRQMLLAALFWRPEPQPWPDDTVLAFPQVTMFHEDWGRPGDVGYVAWEGDRPLGAVWYRRFTDEVHGEGYLDAETPELAIAVIPEARGRGVGRALMDAAHEHARGDGLRRISLSVDDDNPAKRLYASLGYVDRGDELMVLDL
jgi:ribosomal protein S18 acetylase RimI-like enzyme